MKDNNVKSHNKKFTQGNAIPLLLSRINKVKVYRGWEHSCRESKKNGEHGLAPIGCSCREETNTSGHEAGKGAGYSIAQIWSFVCDLRLVIVLPSLPGADGLFLLVCGTVMRKKGKAVIQQLLLDRHNFVLVPTALLPSCFHKRSSYPCLQDGIKATIWNLHFGYRFALFEWSGGKTQTKY